MLFALGGRHLGTRLGRRHNLDRRNDLLSRKNARDPCCVLRTRVALRSQGLAMQITPLFPRGLPKSPASGLVPMELLIRTARTTEDGIFACAPRHGLANICRAVELRFSLNENAIVPTTACQQRDATKQAVEIFSRHCFSYRGLRGGCSLFLKLVLGQWAAFLMSSQSVHRQDTID